MTHDLLLGVAWCTVLAAGLAGAVIARRRHVPATYLRDVLHIGAGSWVLGWPYWQHAYVPLAIVLAAIGTVAMLPLVATRVRLARSVMRSMSGGDERWNGIVFYALSFAVLTPIGLVVSPVAAGGALLALSLGDGIGGFVGRKIGRLRFAVPGGKAKSLEGSVTVAVVSAAAVTLAQWWFTGAVDARIAVIAGGIAAIVEALSPRGTDNVSLPAAVAAWIAA